MHSFLLLKTKYYQIDLNIIMSYIPSNRTHASLVSAYESVRESQNKFDVRTQYEIDAENAARKHKEAAKNVISVDKFNENIDTIGNTIDVVCYYTSNINEWDSSDKLSEKLKEYKTAIKENNRFVDFHPNETDLIEDYKNTVENAKGVFERYYNSPGINFTTWGNYVSDEEEELIKSSATSFISALNAAKFVPNDLDDDEQETPRNSKDKIDYYSRYFKNKGKQKSDKNTKLSAEKAQSLKNIERLIVNKAALELKQKKLKNAIYALEDVYYDLVSHNVINEAEQPTSKTDATTAQPKTAPTAKTTTATNNTAATQPVTANTAKTTSTADTTSTTKTSTQPSEQQSSQTSTTQQKTTDDTASTQNTDAKTTQTADNTETKTADNKTKPASDITIKQTKDNTDTSKTGNNFGILQGVDAPIRDTTWTINDFNIFKNNGDKEHVTRSKNDVAKIGSIVQQFISAMNTQNLLIKFIKIAEQKVLEMAALKGVTN